MKNKIEFLIAAISDTQGTIRALDTKLGVLITLLLLPMAKIWHILEYFKYFYLNHGTLFSFITIGSICITWILSFVVVFRGISAIDNPAIHFSDFKQYKGNFFRGNLFQNTTIIDSLINRHKLKSVHTLDFLYDDMPSTEDEIIKELVFEHSKLVYIRTIKLFRFRYGAMLAIINLSLIVFSYLIYGVHFPPKA